MSFNPFDRATTNALVEYRHQQLNQDIEQTKRRKPRVRRRRRVDYLRQARRSVGFGLIRLGAWLAGTCASPRMGPQL